MTLRDPLDPADLPDTTGPDAPGRCAEGIEIAVTFLPCCLKLPRLDLREAAKPVEAGASWIPQREEEGGGGGRRRGRKRGQADLVCRWWMTMGTMGDRASHIRLRVTQVF